MQKKKISSPRSPISGEIQLRKELKEVEDCDLVLVYETNLPGMKNFENIRKTAFPEFTFEVRNYPSVRG